MTRREGARSGAVVGIQTTSRILPRPILVKAFASTWAQAWLRTILSTVPAEHLDDVCVAAGPLRGTVLRVRVREEFPMWLGVYEAWFQDRLADVVGPGMCCWDVGAFVGYHTLLMHRLCPGGKVLAIEPDPANVERLRRTLVASGASGSVVVEPSAVAAQIGTSRFCTYPGHPSWAKLQRDGGLEVETTTLDALIDQHFPPDVVKVDIEGGELIALEGASRLIREVRPVWLLELHGDATDPALSGFESAGYQVSLRPPGTDHRDGTGEAPVHAIAFPPGWSRVRSLRG